MMGNGSVIGGQYINGTVTLGLGGNLVVQSGLKRRKLNQENVSSWEDVTDSSKSGKLSAVGQAVTGAVLPRFVSKGASAAVGAAIDSSVRPPRTIHVDWADGKQSLIKLPEKLFTHLSMVLATTQVIQPTPDAESTNAAVAEPNISVTEQALTHLSGLIRERMPASNNSQSAPLETSTIQTSEISEQLSKLAALRDAGILTDEEFTAKKTQLLERI